MLEIKDKQVVVTGGAGFIGSHLVDELIRRGSKVTVVDDLSYGLKENVNPKASFIQCSVLDYNTFKKALKGTDFVFHLAANATTKESSMGWKDAIYDNNVNTVVQLMYLEQ